VSILPDPAARVGSLLPTDVAAQEDNLSTEVVGSAATATIAAIADPPTYCPGCLAEAGLPFPERATTRHCPRCLDRIRRVYQCARWNKDHAHQVAAGHASWDAFSARWRASSGLAPLSAEAAWRYVTPDLIRGPMGSLLPERLRLSIYRAWLAGYLVGVVAWLFDDPPVQPDGLWASSVGTPPTG
jgi:hypothetical protein